MDTVPRPTHVRGRTPPENSLHVSRKIF